MDLPELNLQPNLDGWSDPAMLSAFKRALVQARPLEQAAEAYGQALGLAESGCAWQQVAGLREAAAAGAAAFHEIAPGGEKFVAAPPVVIGKGNHRPLRGIARSSWVACLLDARVRGRSGLVEWGGRALVDAEPQERAGFGDRLDADPAALVARAEEICLLAPSDRGAVLEIEEGFSLLGPHGGRFGAWLLHHLAKYVAANLARALPPVPVLIDAGMPRQHRQALEAVLRDGVEIIELAPLQPARVRRLWCAASPAYGPIGPIAGDRVAWELLAAPPARLAAVRAEILRRIAPLATAAAEDEYLFLGSDPARGHDLVNLPALAVNAAARGFRVVDPGALDFAQEVALVRGAAVIAGAAPQALELGWFARTGAELCIFHPPATASLAVWNGLFAGSGIDVAVVTGSYLGTSGAEYRIDPAKLDPILDRANDRPGFSEPPPAVWQPGPRRDRPLVSVLCVTYNHEKFVGEAVRSVLQQTYDPLDIVILDDASPDATAQIIADELATHPRRTDVRFTRNDRNLGANASVRKGLSLVRGDFIVGLASDDVMLPTMVERMARVWSEEGVSLVVANAAYIDEDGGDLHRFYKDPEGPYDDTFEALAGNGANSVCFGPAMAFERQLFVEFGYPPEHLAAEDIMLPFYAYLAKGARFMPEPLLKYRVHGRNSSLMLEWERSGTADRLRVEAEMYSIHLAHSLEMSDELERRVRLDPARFGDIARRIRPLLAQQTRELAIKLNGTRIKLHRLGINRLITPGGVREDPSHAAAG